MSESRKNVLQNIATAVPMPARMLNHETFAEGFGEGTEDAAAESRFITRIRDDMADVYKRQLLRLCTSISGKSWIPELLR